MEVKKIKVGVVDDEPLALELLCSYVQKTPFLQLCGKFNNAIDAYSAINNPDNNIDLLFLDIQMPQLNGLELSKLLNKCNDTKGKPIKIIFTTAFDSYALDGYKVSAIDYLLKPISYPEFLESTQRAAEIINASQQLNQSSNTIYIKSEYKIYKIDINDIQYIEGLKDYVKFYIKDEHNPILSLMSMKTIEEKLSSYNFLRIHKSYIVNCNYIKIIEKARIIINRDQCKPLPIGESFKDAIGKLII